MGSGASFVLVGTAALLCAGCDKPCSADLDGHYWRANAEQRKGALLWLQCTEGDWQACDNALDFDLQEIERRKRAITERGIYCGKRGH